MSALAQLVSSRILSGGPLIPMRYEISAAPIQVVLQEPYQEMYEDGDRHVLVSAPEGEFYYEYQLGICEVEALRFEERVTFESLTPAVAYVEGNIVRRVAGGTARIRATSDSGITREITLDMTNHGTVSEEFVDFLEGSWAESVSRPIDQALIYGGSLPLYLVADHANGVYRRSFECWARLFDLSCCSPWNSGAGHLRAGTLVTPRHLLFAAHYPLAAGWQVRLINPLGVVFTYTIEDVCIHPSYSPGSGAHDVGIAQLSEDVHPSITFAEVLPPDNSNWLPHGISEVPLVIVDQEELALLAEGVNLATAFSLKKPTAAIRIAKYEDAISGDSGSPVLAITSGRPILIGVLTYGGAGQGTFVTAELSHLNTMIQSMGSSYRMTEADLSSFDEY